MKNKRGLQLVVSTAIIMILSVVVLVLLVILFRDNFSIFQERTQNILETSEGVSAKQSCELACESNSRFVYCCNEFKVLDEMLKCYDERLEINCNLDCESFNCGVEDIGG